MKYDNIITASSIPIPSFRETSEKGDEDATSQNDSVNLRTDADKIAVIPSIVNSVIKEMITSVPDCPQLKAYFLSQYVHMEFPNVSIEHDMNYSSLCMINGVIVIPYSNHIIDQQTPYPGIKRCTTVSETLESLIDGVIYSLVQRRNKLQKNVLFRMPNMLSMGYTQVSENGYSPHSFCSNMPPGILCTQINSSVTYVKTSGWLKDFHLSYGDDFLRELLLHCILLTPSSCKNHCVDSKDLNYLQLSGPPLDSFLGKKWHLRAALSKKSQSKTQRDSHSSREKMPNRTFFQTYIPRHYMLYSQIFVKKVGLPSSHILNRRPAVDEKQDHCLLLLHSMFNIYFVNARGKRCFRKNVWNRLKMCGIEMCRMLLIRHRKTDYARILESTCPLPPGIRRNDKHQNESPNTNGNILIDENSSICTQDITTNNTMLMKEEKSCNNQNINYNIIENITSCYGSDSASLSTSSTTPSSCHTKNTNHENPPKLTDLVHSFMTNSQVYKFLTVVLKSVFPYPQFWGSVSNFTMFCQTLQIFLSLAKKETLQMGNILQGISITTFSWLSSTNKKNARKKKSSSSSDHITMTRLVGKLFQWVYCKFIIPLLRSIFYITDTEFLDKDCLVYYRKPVWSKIHSLTMESLLGKTEANSNPQYKEMPSKESSFIWQYLSNLRMGCSKLRLLPKKNGIRPIALLSKRLLIQLEAGSSDGDTNSPGSKRLRCMPTWKSKKPDNYSVMPWLLRERSLSTNVILRQVFEVLKYEYVLKPSRFGCGMLGPSDIYSRLRLFLNEFKQLPKNKNTLYFCSADINKCYDNIHQGYLYDVINGILSSEDYLSQKYSVVYNNSQCANNIQSKPVRQIGPPEDFRLLETVDEIFAKQYKRSIIIDQVNSLTVLKKIKLLSLLKEHLFNNVVVTNGSFGHPRFLIQSSGIPQGSILSSFLCNYYYGHLEQQLLKDIPALSNVSSDNTTTTEPQASILLRMMDDFVFITTDKAASIRFLTNMHNGIPELGVRVNEAKTRSSYDVKFESNIESGSKREYNIKSQCIEKKKKILFPWCGLLFDVQTCEVRVDYSRFETKLFSATNIQKKKGEINPLPVLAAAFKNGKELLHRMKSFVRPRCQPLFFDSYVNRKDVVIQNFYEMLHFCAEKTMNYISYSLEGGVRKNSNYIRKCVEEVILYSYQLVLYLLKKAGANMTTKLSPSDVGSKNVLHLNFSKQYALSIGKKAFNAVFSRRQAEYNDLINC